MTLPLTFALVSIAAFLAGAIFSRWERSQVIKQLRAERDAYESREMREDAFETVAFKAGELEGFKEGIREGVRLEREGWVAEDGGGEELEKMIREQGN